MEDIFEKAGVFKSAWPANTKHRASKSYLPQCPGLMVNTFETFWVMGNWGREFGTACIACPAKHRAELCQRKYQFHAKFPEGVKGLAGS